MKKKHISHNLLYVILFGISILFIITHITIDGCIKIENKIPDCIKTIIEIMAFGMLPGVLVSFLIERSMQSSQRENWKKYVESSKMLLKQKCEWLASDVLVSINQVVEKCDEEEERKTFVQWCEILFSEYYTEKYSDGQEAFLEDVKSIKEETIKVFGIISEYQDFITQDERKREMDICTQLIDACKQIRIKERKADKTVLYRYQFDKLAIAIYGMFEDLKENYTIAYNSEDYADEKF
ncbi:MAG: hypothetical protein IKZ35_00430 [Clostridia bacterium]|nr:hypothetical protein [Clostridia bacterium]